MTEEEVHDWVQSLALTDFRRLRVINTLLENKQEDQMTEEDEEVCNREKKRLERVLEEERHAPAA